MHRNTAPVVSTSSTKRRQPSGQREGKDPKRRCDVSSEGSLSIPLVHLDDEPHENDDEIQILHHSPPPKKSQPLNRFPKHRQREETIATTKSLVNKDRSHDMAHRKKSEKDKFQRNSKSVQRSLAHTLAQFVENARAKRAKVLASRTPLTDQKPMRVPSQLKGPLRPSI